MDLRSSNKWKENQLSKMNGLGIIHQKIRLLHPLTFLIGLLIMHSSLKKFNRNKTIYLILTLDLKRHLKQRFNSMHLTSALFPLLSLNHLIHLMHLISLLLLLLVQSRRLIFLRTIFQLGMMINKEAILMDF